MLVQILHYQCPVWLHALQEVPHWPVPDFPVSQVFDLRLVQSFHVREFSEQIPSWFPLYYNYSFIIFETTTTR